MTEQAYQKKIIKAIKADGGHAFTGSFPKGEADIVAGVKTLWYNRDRGMMEAKLLFAQIEVKTEHDYHRVMNSLVELDGVLEIHNRKGLKDHEPLQIAKINKIRSLGGLGLFAFEYKQVKEYINDNK